MFYILFITSEEVAKSSSQILEPAIVAAIIAAVVALPSLFLSFRSLKLQRLQSERNEIYKKLNDFYGPMRLHLKSSDELYKLFSKSVIKRLNLDPKKFRTLPFILDGNSFNKTESALFAQIISIGEKMEQIIGSSAGLIDDDDLHKEMIKLSTHLRIIRMAYNNEFLTGKEKEVLLECKTFPNDITGEIDKTFYEFKKRLDKLNRKQIKAKKVKRPSQVNEVSNFPSPE